VIALVTGPQRRGQRREALRRSAALGRRLGVELEAAVHGRGLADVGGDVGGGGSVDHAVFAVEAGGAKLRVGAHARSLRARRRGGHR
jgi:hypothetical protein